MFSYQGGIGQFDFLTLVLTIYAGLAFVALVTWALDKLATTYLPNNDEYASYMELETPPIHCTISPY